ncbi:AAEL000114-PA [Aedes aegypti]|uniref:AAEL000114-PA n=1 Tax=Aedes aegypti TaxID=7159 RepID=Q17Q60_AEDAE|nr:AAEL000114-PA [Aedes aegypti]
MAVNPAVDESVNPTRRGREDGFRIENYSLEDGQEVTYTSAYFARHPGVGPALRISRSPAGETLETLIGAILGAGQNMIDVGVALRYVWLCFERITGRLDEAWESHGVLIGAAGAEIIPRNLIHLVEEGEGEPYAGGNPGNSTQWLRALALVLSPIRLNSQLRREYLDTLTIKYKATLEVFAGVRVNDSPGTFALQHSAWNQNANFLRFAAALDMFLFHFKDHEASKLRFCTVTCRFRDCAGISDLRFILKILGLSMVEFSQWVWTADDLERLLRPLDGIDRSDSFTSYIASMRLCAKSPYSATANPNLHVFVHAIGCANLRFRSINSRMVGDVNLADTVANAAILNYVRGSRYNLQPEFYRRGSTMAPDGNRQALEAQSVARSIDLEL